MARKTYTYDAKTGRFRDASGHFISKAKALRSSVARQQFEKSQRKRKKPSKPAPPPRRSVAKPAPRPPRRPPAARRTFTYDSTLGRFRDSAGKIISKTRGLRSAVARAQYEAAQRRKAKKPPVKKKPPRKAAPPKKKPPRRIKPRRRVRPLISESAKAPGQFTVENVQTLSHEELAEMLLTQVVDGYKRFRFWYKMKSKSVDYPTGIGSTQPLWWTVLTGKKPSLDRTIAFVKGHYGWILGKITMYWMSKR